MVRERERERERLGKRKRNETCCKNRTSDVRCRFSEDKDVGTVSDTSVVS